ncbi:MAG: stage II sporulation protein M [Flavobacteriales bacterium]|nr:MAG: stage II sporulation protein M [Flavobacteriales bacterium]
MREAAFIKRNQAKWQRLEQSIAGLGQLSGDEASDLYIQLTDDLSYARTFYPKSAVVSYLNGLAVRLHQHIYRNKRTPRGRFISFWAREVPQALAEARRNLALSFAIFAVAVLIGAVSAAHDDTFVRLILGDDYVDMTLDNIKQGRPMGVYESMEEGGMFLHITTNNIRVSFVAFVAGLLASFGTVLVLLYNGVMLGSFQYFFHEQGVLAESVLTIWVHGTLEISAIVVAGGAGLTLGNSWLFPGTYTRGESLRRGARTGLKVVMGLLPVFIAAGFLESFVTRHALTLRPWVAITIILASLAWVIHYFIILPYHAERRRAGPVAPGA